MPHPAIGFDFPFPTPPGCSRHPEIVEPSTRGWTLDACATFFVAERIRPPEEMPNPDSPDGLLFLPGSSEPTTLNPIRAIGDTSARDGDPNPEVCAHHRGTMTVGTDGYARSVFCIRPVEFDTATHRNTLCDTIVATQPMIDALAARGINGLLEVGYAYDVGAYPTPPWAELMMHSPGRHVCGATD